MKKKTDVTTTIATPDQDMPFTTHSCRLKPNIYGTPSISYLTRAHVGRTSRPLFVRFTWFDPSESIT